MVTRSTERSSVLFAQMERLSFSPLPVIVTKTFLYRSKAGIEALVLQAEFEVKPKHLGRPSVIILAVTGPIGPFIKYPFELTVGEIGIIISQIRQQDLFLPEDVP